METLSVISAKSVWLVNLAEMNPKGLRLLPNISDALTEMYDFDQQPEDAPTSVGITGQGGVKFKNGQFETVDGHSVRVGLELYDDGIVAETSVSTEITDLFIAHALEWATTAFGLRYDPHLVVRRMHDSEVVVRISSSFSGHSPPFDSFASLLSTSMPGEKVFMPTGITFSAAGSIPNPITIERRANTPPEANIFYSKAPMETASHLTLLREFESLLSDKH